MQPTLKAPGTKRFKLRYDEPLSNFAFIFNLCRSNKAFSPAVAAVEEVEAPAPVAEVAAPVEDAGMSEAAEAAAAGVHSRSLFAHAEPFYTDYTRRIPQRALTPWTFPNTP